MNKKKLAILSLAVLLGVSACGEKNEPTKKPSTPDSTVEPSTPESSVVLKEFTGLEFEGKSVVYDGKTHSLEVKNAPADATIVYTNNGKIDAGTYEVSALVTKEGYVDKKLNASLTIIPGEIKGLVFENDSFEYDSKPHTVGITGNLPEGSKVTYSCAENPEITNVVTDPGEYTITATVTNKNFKKVELVATFKVVSKEETRYLTSFGGKIYFQNALDKDKLYTYDKTNGVVKVNSNKAQYFTNFKNQLYYRSDSLLSPSIVALEPTNLTTTITTDNAEFICDDEQYIYYADNSLAGDNGIYRLDIQGNTVVPQKLYDGKAYYLQVIGDNIYFADGKNGKKLSRISKSVLNQTTASLLIDVKIKEMISKNNSLFFTVNGTADDYIAQYNIGDQSAIKLTCDAGKYLTVVNDELYYVNNDILTSNLIGKGVYKTKINIKHDNITPGTLALSNTYKDYPISSLYYDGSDLYFYQTFTKRLYSYNIKTGELVDKLEDFVVPEDQNLLAQKGAVAPFGNKIYYQNQYDGNNLYVYDTVSQTNIRITSTAVDDLYIYKDYLYYRQVSYFVNKDLYRIDIKNGGTPEEISKEDCGELEIYNDKIYYTNYSGSNEIHMMNLDGSNDTVICEESAYNLRVYNNRLYYVVNATGATTGYIYYVDLNDTTKAPVKFDKIRSSYFEIHNDKIYLRHLSGFGYKDKELAVMDLDGNNLQTVYNNKCDPNNFVIVDDVVYYNNDVTGSYSVNSYNLVTKENKVIIKDVFAYNLQYVNGNLYYQSYCFGGTLGDGHFYELSLDGTQKRIA